MADTSKLRVWNLGLEGVNVVDSPLHIRDGELRLAQNCETFADEGEGGIRKRLGIGALTPVGTGLPILAITSIPLPDVDLDPYS